jgi:hypothetical protein
MKEENMGSIRRGRQRERSVMQDKSPLFQISPSTEIFSHNRKEQNIRYGRHNASIDTHVFST